MNKQDLIDRVNGLEQQLKEASKQTYYRINKLKPSVWQLVKLENGIEKVMEEDMSAIVWAKYQKLIFQQLIPPVKKGK